jgi:hypothetical protein
MESIRVAEEEVNEQVVKKVRRMVNQRKDDILTTGK